MLYFLTWLPCVAFSLWASFTLTLRIRCALSFICLPILLCLLLCLCAFGCVLCLLLTILTFPILPTTRYITITHPPAPPKRLPQPPSIFMLTVINGLCL